VEARFSTRGSWLCSRETASQGKADDKSEGKLRDVSGTELIVSFQEADSKIEDHASRKGSWLCF